MHVRRALALTLAVPLLLSGCSEDEPTPKIPDPTTSSATPTPDETETPEAESAEEFIRRWQTLGDAMQKTGDVTEFRDLSKGCQACATLIRNVQSVYRAGGSIDFAGSEITLLESIATEPPTFNLDMRTPRTVIRTADGEVEQEYPAGTGKYVITLAKEGEGWRVAHYARR